MKEFFDTKTKKFLVIIIALLVVSSATVWYAVYIESERSELTIAFLDIGQGDSIFIEAPNGNQVLVDAGPNAKVLSELGKVMPWYDKSLDMIVMTHPDQDHIGGFVDVLKRYSVQYELEPGVESKTLTNATIHELIDQNHIQKVIARRGMKIVLDEKRNIVLMVLYPDTDVTHFETNKASIVARLTYGDTEVVLTGDAPKDVEQHILSLSTTTPDKTIDLNLASDILKAGHHGSKTSTSEEWVGVLNPQYVVISSGKGNKYGHPNQETLDTLAKFPDKILRTDELGTIIFKSDGKSLVLEN